MELPSGYWLENVWENKGEELREEIVRFWLASAALPARDRAVERVDQVIFIVRHGNGEIAGVSTVYKRLNAQLGNTFYYFRCFVAEAHRQENLGAVLLLAARDFLNERYASGKEPEAIGLFVEVENERLKTMRNQAVWPYSQMVYVGKNARGDHLRVFYFDGARIS
jgi:hypothetical protein